MPLEEKGLERSEERQLAGDPGHDQKRRESCGEGRVRGHCFVSSNAWSTRKYVTCRPRGFTRTKSFGTCPLITKSICATYVWWPRSERVPDVYSSFWNVTAALYGGFLISVRLTF